MKRENVVLILLTIVIALAILIIALTLYHDQNNHGIPIQDLRDNSLSK